MLNQVHRIEQLAQPLQRVILALKGDEQRVGCGEHVERDQSKRWWAVNKDEIVLVAHKRDGVAHPAFATRQVHQFDLCASQIRCSR